MIDEHAVCRSLQRAACIYLTLLIAQKKHTRNLGVGCTSISRPRECRDLNNPVSTAVDYRQEMALATAETADPCHILERFTVLACTLYPVRYYLYMSSPSTKLQISALGELGELVLALPCLLMLVFACFFWGAFRPSSIRVHY